MPRSARRRRLAALWFSLHATVAFAQYDGDYCQLVDRYEEPLWNAYIGYVSEAAGGETIEKLGILEFGGGAGLFYYHTYFGEFDLKVQVDAISFTGRGTTNMPGLLAAAHADLDYTLKLQDGYSVRLGMAPGVYSHIMHVNGDHVFYPFRLHGIRAFSPNVSGLAGLNFYPGFHRLIDPTVGVRWALSDFLLLDIFYPRTDIVFRPSVNWALRAGVEIDRTSEFRLKRKDERDSLILDQTRLSLRLDRLLDNDWLLMFELGRIVDRSLEFRREQASQKLEDAYYFRIGLGGHL